jgi:tetratricopeptide (TPR) repeat protein
MGRSGPLDHPELLAVQKLLDDRDLAEAQRQLARLGTREELAHGITFLTTRLLHARGRLDLRGVAERLRELLAISPEFEEALSMLAQAEVKVSSRAPSPPPTQGGRRPSPATPVVPRSEREPGSRRAPQTPRVAESDRAGGKEAGSASARSNASRPTSRPANKKRGKSGRVFTPVTGFEATASPLAPEPAASPGAPARIPHIPRAPALPQFRDNPAPPSYAPERAATEPDLFRGKSLLPRNAGRYSETPKSMDVVETNRRRRSKAAPAVPSGPPGQRQRRETTPQTPERIRSASPPNASTELPTLFEIASWIDEGRFRDAVAAINRAGPTAGPEYSILRARALAGAGYVEQALDLLEQIDKKPSPDAELRAATARLFVELGDPKRALVIATQALEAEPDRPLIRLTYALAAVRSCRRQRDITLLDRAERALEKFAAREGPLPALYLALRACIQAGAGDPQRAISTAQRALGLDPKSPDALAAIAEASTRLGRVHDARQAWSKLAEIAPSEGEAVAVLIAQIGPRISSRDIAPASDNAPLWTPIDSQLVAGKRREALAALESAAQDAIRRIARSVMDDFTAVAAIGGSFLTTSPVLSSFAPYDSSLWSVRRLEAALDLITGRDGGSVLSALHTGLVVLLGSYLGETLRLSQSGRWDGRPADLDSAKIVTAEHTIYPFRILAARLHHGRRAAFESSLHLGIPKPGSASWRSHVGNPVAPPTPWAPNPWPPPSQIGIIGRSLSESPIARYCEEFAEGPLDRSTASLIALDTYLDLVAPRGAPIDADAAWTRRVSVLAGGYLGETLRELVGGEWVYGVDAADDALAFRLKLRGTTEALPVAQVLERVIGERSSTLVDYARTLMRRVGRA